MKDYSMYRYYKGETENPFDNEKQNTQFMFWFYESVFETLFNRESNGYWRNHSNECARQKFCNALAEKGNDRPTESEKAAVFDVWLNDCFFVDKLYPEWGAKENWHKEQYYINSI